MLPQSGNLLSEVRSGLPESTYASALSPEYALLGLLARSPGHGYELHQRLKTELGQVWHVSLSQTYNILKRLEGQGYIAGELERSERQPQRLRFSLTSGGRERLQSWLRAPTGSSVRAIRVEFITRLYFAAFEEDAGLPERLLHAQHAETRAGLHRLEALYQELPEDETYNRLSLALRIRQLKAVLEWIEDARQALKINES
jgi:DNA-binding PadR family transcriptional regulator